MVALRGAMEVAEIYFALAGLPSEQRHALANSIQGQNRADLVNATLATIPAGAVWLARKAARDAAIDETNRFVARARDAAWEIGQPQRILNAIEESGTQISYAKPTGLMAAGSEISDELLASLRTYRAGIEELVCARQTASAPRVIA